MKSVCSKIGALLENTNRNSKPRWKIDWKYRKEIYDNKQK